MNGPEHYREAESLLGASEKLVDDGHGGLAAYAVDRAHVHANLALAAAVALGGSAKMASADYDAWDDAAGAGKTFGPTR